jgi:phosphoribosylglycinamide formyltransferase-1
VIRAAVLAAGEGSLLQAILDAVYFNEIPDFELEAVICPRREDYAMTRARHAGVPAFVVDPELFPTMTSHSIAVANKLKDMDIDLVILAGYDCPLGYIPYQFKNRIIGTFPALWPAFGEEEDPVQATLDNGVKITGATAYFADGDGRVGAVIAQKAIDVLSDDTKETLAQRILEDCEWELLTRAVILCCGRKLSVRGRVVTIKE